MVGDGGAAKSNFISKEALIKHLMREGGGIATSIGVLEAWGTSFRSCQGARLDVVSALTLCNP